MCLSSTKPAPTSARDTGFYSKDIAASANWVSISRRQRPCMGISLFQLMTKSTSQTILPAFIQHALWPKCLFRGGERNALSEALIPQVRPKTCRIDWRHPWRFECLMSWSRSRRTWWRITLLLVQHSARARQSASRATKRTVRRGDQKEQKRPLGDVRVVDGGVVVAFLHGSSIRNPSRDTKK